MSVYNRRASSVNLQQLVTNIPVRRKAADQVERERFEWTQWQSASKAVNNLETPAKEKHVRNLILGTFRLEGARLFWSMCTRLQLESHPIVCWKFCYVIHRLLRDGHKYVVHDSIPLTAYFDQLGKFWNSLRQSYGTMTYRYCRLMITKLGFHERNVMFTGNLSIGEGNDVRRVFGDNLDLYFQLSIELMDYMDELLGLVDAVFTSLDQSRANSMTAVGQCRLHPLILCVQDSSLLYDYVVKVLFKLHDSLTGDTLTGHRTRLNEQFRRLKKFYEQASTLQYFRDLIKVPILPDNPPNFKIKEDYKNYHTPVATIVAPPPEPTQVIEDALIDTSDTISNMSFPTASDPFMGDGWPPNGHVDHRAKEIADLEQRLLQYDIALREVRDQTHELHKTISQKDSALIEEKNHRLQLEEQLRQQLENTRRIEEMHTLEQKVNSDEKYVKMRDQYNKLREEHILVLRRKLEEDYNKLKDDCDHINFSFNTKTSEFETLDNEILQLRKTNDELNDTITQLTREQNEFKTSDLATSNRIKEVENEKKIIQEQYKQLQDEKMKVDNQLTKDISEFERKLKEYELIRKDLLAQNREHEENLIDLVHEKEVLETKVEDLELTTQDLAKKLHFINESQKLLQQNHSHVLENLKESYKHYCISHVHDGIERSNDAELLYCKSGAEYLLSCLKSSLSSLTTTHDQWKKHQLSEGVLLSFLNECVSLSNFVSDVVVHGKATSNLVQDVDKGVELADNCRDVGTSCIEIFDTYRRTIIPEHFEDDIKNLTRKLNKLITHTTNLLPKVTDISKEELGDLVEKELQNTHETIDEAVRQIQALLEKSRITDTGIKLEVNGKILDTCGELMQTIRQLIMKARDLQKEIVSQGRGTATAKEFYTKNHKWTEGLVSAAKNVGLNAKVLIESADHLLSGDGKFEEIIACSNEIASATAQLVAASNVKADRESKNREGLTQASKQVAAATARVVATAKSGASTIEEKSTMDFSSYSLHKTKRAEMDAQVKVLELEKQLEQAKVSLYTLRKRHYQLAGEDEGWDTNQQDHDRAIPNRAILCLNNGTYAVLTFYFFVNIDDCYLSLRDVFHARHIRNFISGF
ncbi:unnamed protein product [Didymodactylos carnosus]|uniref:Huntingtin-interacting protein 1 n=2 Tax=Didymodactylos carnosus TaxID=1234261 RepID=A0A814BI33_9BILA|nr:unnamed protein product [Didymodactylos carnosus]CAF3705639.1 unnamed protein product [Didymodactylos carnosus]